MFAANRHPHGERHKGSNLRAQFHPLQDPAAEAEVNELHSELLELLIFIHHQDVFLKESLDCNLLILGPASEPTTRWEYIFRTITITVWNNAKKKHIRHYE